jgi:hypothetical protein
MSDAHEHADSAGQSWSGRSFEPNAFAADDGSAPAAYVEALATFRALAADDASQAAAETQDDVRAKAQAHAAVVDVVRASRFLIPLVAEVGDEGVNAEGLRVDKTQELAIVRVQGPDGQTVLPIFSSVTAMAHWRADARPVPADGLRSAASALLDNCDWVVIDATSDTELVLRRPALRAIAAQEPWIPPHADARVEEYVSSAVSPDERIDGFSLATGDQHARGSGPDLIIRLVLEPGLSPDAVTQLLADFSGRLSDSELLAERVDSLLVQLMSHQN